MNLIDWLFLCISVGIGFAYVCRADGLKLMKHKPEYLLFHLGMFGVTVFAGFDAAHGVTSVRTGCALLGAGMWLVLSFPTWRIGPPEHTLRQPRSSTLEAQHEDIGAGGHRL